MSVDINTAAIDRLADVNPPSRDARLKPETLVSFIPMADVSEDGRWVNRQTRRYREVSQGYTPFREGDVLFAKITPCMENGKGAHAIGLENGIGFGTTEFHVLRAKRHTDARYLYHWLQSLQLRHRAEAMMTGSAGQRRVPTSFFERFEVPFLPFPEQRRIAEILDTIDDAIQATEALIAKLRQARAGLVHDLLTRGIDEHGHLRDPDAHPEQFKDSPIGRVPREWEIRSIDSLTTHVGSGVTPRGGADVYKSDGVLFIRSQNVTFDGLLLDDAAYIDTRTHMAMARSELQPNDVLINITGASIGRCCIFPAGSGAANVNQHVCAIRLAETNRIDSVFLSSVLSSPIGQSQIDRLNAGSNRQGLNYQQLRSFIVPWPSARERTAAVGIIDHIGARIATEEALLHKLRATGRGLMDDLLTGRVQASELAEASRAT